MNGHLNVNTLICLPVLASHLLMRIFGSTALSCLRLNRFILPMQQQTDWISFTIQKWKHVLFSLLSYKITIVSFCFCILIIACSQSLYIPTAETTSNSQEMEELTMGRR